MKKIPFNIYPFGIIVLGMLQGYLIIMLLYFWKWKSEVDYFSSFHELWLTNKKYVYLSVFNMMLWYTYTLWWSFNTDSQMSSMASSSLQQNVYTHTTAFHSPISGCIPGIHWFCPCTPSGWELGIEKCNYFPNWLENKGVRDGLKFHISLSPKFFHPILWEYKNGISVYNFSSLELPA